MLDKEDLVRNYLEQLRPGVLVVGESNGVSILEKSHQAILSASVLVKIVVQAQEEKAPGWTTFQDLKTEANSAEHLKDPDVDIHNDTCFIVFTSGTTALPKACLHTGASISALTYNSIRFENLDKDRISLAQLPAYHIWSITNLIILWSVGGKALLPAPVFNPVASVKAITEGRCTDVHLVPAMLMAMTSLSNFRPESIKGLRSIAFGGTLIRPSFTLAARKDLSVDHTVVFYGMSEAMGIAGFVWGDSVAVSEDSCSIGKCAQGMSVKICSANSKDPLERNISGDLHVSGPSVMKGYLTGEIGDF